MHFALPAEIFGVDGIIILVVVVVVLFGSTQIPKLARSLGSAQKEFKKGLDEGGKDDPARPVVVAQVPPVATQVPPVVATPPTVVAPPPSGNSTGTPS